MDTTNLLSMAAFALAASISPGPVNIVALASGIRYGFRRSVAHVTGATVGFTFLLVLVGYCLNDALERFPMMLPGVRWAGIAFLLYMSFKLVFDDGSVDADGKVNAPSFRHGALMQWLNPKAWLASIAGVGAFATAGSSDGILIFASIYFAVCYASIACWAAAGAVLREHIGNPAHVRMLNRALATLLLISAGFLAWESVLS